MEVFLENIGVFGVTGILFILIMFLYLRNQKRKSDEVGEKIIKAKEYGLHEPVSLHPVVDIGSCIQSGACITACPEKDILGIQNGKATTINASRCVGHGACFHACPVQAITLCIGTEIRGVELPHVSQNFESNISGLFIAGELGGMGLIKNAVEQGKQAILNLSKSNYKKRSGDYDVIIIGAGPAGIAATLQAKKVGLKFLTIEQDSLGGTVYSFPRKKIIMTRPMNLPLYGKINRTEMTKDELLDIWTNILELNNITINENVKVENILKNDKGFTLVTKDESYTSKTVLLSIGRRGSPRKLNVPGEELEKVSYRLLEPEMIENSEVLVVGGGDSAIESALLLSEESVNCKVSLSYRKDKFGRIKPDNLKKISKAIDLGKINMIFNSTVTEIFEDSVKLNVNGSEPIEIKNDLIYIFAGGELPSKFLEKIGITITKKFGDAILKH